MKTVDSIVADNKTNHSLHHLVEEVIQQLSSLQATRNNQIVNNVPDNLFVSSKEEGVLFSVINGMLFALLSNAADGDIHIYARELFGNTVKVFVKDRNCYNTYAVACALQKLVPVAEKIGGFLNIVNQRQKITTIEFSFPLGRENQPADED